jgi:hypothetical protein
VSLMSVGSLHLLDGVGIDVPGRVAKQYSAITPVLNGNPETDSLAHCRGALAGAACADRMGLP